MCSGCSKELFYRDSPFEYTYDMVDLEAVGSKAGVGAVLPP